MKGIFVLVALSIFIVLEVEAEKTCKQVSSDITKRQLQGMGKCSKSMKFKNGKDKAQKTNCILKCVMINEGFLDAEGKLTKEQFEILMDKEIPANLRAAGYPLFDDCRVKHADNLDPTEEFCKSYDPLVKCLLGALAKLCAT